MIGRLAHAFCLLLIVVTSTGGAAAQDTATVKAGLNVWKSAGCAECHGPFADGDKQNDDAPTGANLRTTRLEGDLLVETIRCGRPGTGMPAFDEGAYSDRGCYGQPEGDPPDGLEPAPRTLSLKEIDDVAAYLKARVIGHRTITPDDCAFYYQDEASSACAGKR